MKVWCIVLGDGRRVPMRNYVAGWRKAAELPATVWCDRTPSGWPGTAGEALREFRAGMHDRINRHLPWYGRGRKWGDDWQRAATITAAHVNTPRVLVRWLPVDLRDRLKHRLASE